MVLLSIAAVVEVFYVNLSSLDAGCKVVKVLWLLLGCNSGVCIKAAGRWKVFWANACTWLALCERMAGYGVLYWEGLVLGCGHVELTARLWIRKLKLALKELRSFL